MTISLLGIGVLIGFVIIMFIVVVAAIIIRHYTPNKEKKFKKDIFFGELENTDAKIKNARKSFKLTNSIAVKN